MLKTVTNSDQLSISLCLGPILSPLYFSPISPLHSQYKRYVQKDRRYSDAMAWSSNAIAWSFSRSAVRSRLGESMKPAPAASAITSRLPFRQVAPRDSLPMMALQYLSASLMDAFSPESSASSRAASF